VPASPIVKWVGGKTKLLPELRARLPKTYKRYFEPFVGGAALFFALEPQDAVLGDMNDALIDTYRAVQQAVENVIEELAVHRKKHVRDDYYYEVRTAWNAGKWQMDAVGHAAAFIYLNKTCFNGLWRVNKKNEFNTPRGDYNNPKIFDPAALRAASKALKTTVLLEDGYAKTSEVASKGDFVYFDPPYDPISKTSNFTSYTKDGFGDEQQEALALHAETLHRRGVHVMLSNNDTPFIRNLYKGFCIDTVQCGRSINSKGDKRGKVNEVIVTSYGATS
jgi:DNA adenine methylase